MIKPILFNTDMVRALQNGTKTVTRRAVKPQPDERLVTSENSHTLLAAACAPYRPGDILYVRETWRVQSARRFDADARIEFKAGGDMVRIQFPGGGDQYHSRTRYDIFVRRWADDRWHPSIHMPREAARIFLRVTKVYPQRLKDVTEEDAKAEGFHSRAEFISAILNIYPNCTEESWFWANEFERISAKEAER